MSQFFAGSSSNELSKRALRQQGRSSRAAVLATAEQVTVVSTVGVAEHLAGMSVQGEPAGLLGAPACEPMEAEGDEAMELSALEAAVDGGAECPSAKRAPVHRSPPPHAMHVRTEVPGGAGVWVDPQAQIARARLC